MSELPEGWVQVRLGEVATKVGSGATPKGGQDAYHDSGTPLIRSLNVHFSGFKRTNLAFIDEQQARALDGVRVSAGDVLLNITGASIGRVTTAPQDMAGARVNQHVAIIRTQGGVDQVFLAKFLASPEQQAFIQENESGATRQALTKEKILDFQVPLPPLNEQKRIVAKIDALTEKSREAREALAEVPELLDKLRQSILAAAFRGDLTKKWREQNPDVEPATVLLERIRAERRKKWEEAELAKFKAKGKVPTDDRWKAKYVEPEPVDTDGLPELPEGWSWASVEDLVVEPLANGRSVPTRDDGFPVLRLTALKDDKVDLSERKGGEWTAKEAESFLVADGDFLISRGNGSLDRVALGGYVRNPDPVAFPDTLIRIRPSAAVHADYFAKAWASPTVRGQVERKAKTTAGIHKVSQTDVGSIVVPIAPRAEQEVLVRKAAMGMESVLLLRATSSNVVNSLRACDSSILAKAFRGELVPQDPNDEPASVLLERVRKERDAAAAKTKRPKRGAQTRV